MMPYAAFVKNSPHVLEYGSSIWDRIMLGMIYELENLQNVTKTSPCNEHPLTPHFYKIKLGFTGVYIFSYFCSIT